jgi:hypothetical protein
VGLCDEAVGRFHAAGAIGGDGGGDAVQRCTAVLGDADIAVGYGHMVWTGIGAVGAFVAGVVLLGESASVLRLIAAALIVGGLVLMKFASPT